MGVSFIWSDLLIKCNPDCIFLGLAPISYCVCSLLSLSRNVPEVHGTQTSWLTAKDELCVNACLRTLMLQGYMANKLDQLIVIIYTVVHYNATLCLLDSRSLTACTEQTADVSCWPVNCHYFVKLNCERWSFWNNVETFF